MKNEAPNTTREWIVVAIALVCVAVTALTKLASKSIDLVREGRVLADEFWAAEQCRS